MDIGQAKSRLHSKKLLIMALLAVVLGIGLLIGLSHVTRDIIEHNMRLLMVRSETEELVQRMTEVQAVSGNATGGRGAMRLMQFQVSEVRQLLHAALYGGKTSLGSLRAITDPHMRGDLQSLDELLVNVDTEGLDDASINAAKGKLPDIIEPVASLSKDVAGDIGRVIENHEYYMIFIQGGLFLIMLVLFFGVIFVFYRHRIVIKEQDKNMREEIARRTQDLEILLEKNNDQLKGLKTANSRLVLINSSVSQLQDAGELIALAEKNEALLRKLVRDAMGLAKARYGAISIYDKEGNIQSFIAEGFSKETVKKIVGLPVGKGLLRVFHKQMEPLRIKDVTQDSRFTGFPSGHPSMNSLMGVPIVVGDECRGAVYLADKIGEEEFSEDDEAVLHLYAIDLGNAIERSDFIGELQNRNEELQHKQVEQESLISQLKNAQMQLLQSEKMASIGQLAAGVAHEINNPIGYVGSNLVSLQQYAEDMCGLLGEYEKVESSLPQDGEMLNTLLEYKKSVDIDYVRQDLRDLIKECTEGISRVRKIVNDLKDFSHVGGSEWQYVDIHKGIDSTLNIAHNEIKYKARVIKEYGSLPEIECMPHQLNQVFMNLLVNAAHSLEKQGTITIRTGIEGEGIWVEIADTGKGIKPEHLSHVFEPFFTTKVVGKGTGLGLSVSYNIVRKHSGHIEVDSEIGKGTRFRIWLPIEQLNKAEDNTENGASLNVTAGKG